MTTSRNLARVATRAAGWILAFALAACSRAPDPAAAAAAPPAPAPATASASASAALPGWTAVPAEGGGQVAYGAVPGAASVPAAFGAVLHDLHQQFGVRPDVSRVVEAQGGGAPSLRFSVTPPGKRAVAGILFIAGAAGGGFQGGIAYDDADRLQVSFHPMLQSLMRAWHPQAGAGTPAVAAAPAPAAAAPLQTYTLPDRTASVGLPAGWNVAPQSAGGTILAMGPNTEQVALGYTYLVIDTSTPHGRQMQQAAAGPLRNTVYARNLYYPYGAPLGRTFVDLNAQQRRLLGQPAAPLRMDDEQPIASGGGQRCAHLRGEGDPQNDHHPVETNSIFCVSPPEPASGSYLAVVFHTAVPRPQADAERATMAAILASFRSDPNAIQRMANQMAAPEIARIHAIGAMAARQAADADAARIASRQAYEARSDAQDRQHQAFSNYLLDQSVVYDADHDAHGTVWNQSADALVRADPRRFSYVDTGDFWKGVDY